MIASAFRVLLSIPLLPLFGSTRAHAEDRLFPPAAPSAQEIIGEMFSPPKNYFRRLLAEKPHYNLPGYVAFFELEGCLQRELRIFKHPVVRGISTEATHSKREIFDVLCKEQPLRFLLERESASEIEEIPINEFVQFDWYGLEKFSGWRLYIASGNSQPLAVDYAADLAIDEEKVQAWELSVRYTDQERPFLGVLQSKLNGDVYLRRYENRLFQEFWASATSFPTQQKSLRNLIFRTQEQSRDMSPTTYQQYMQNNIVGSLSGVLWFEGNALPNLQDNF